MMFLTLLTMIINQLLYIMQDLGIPSMRRRSHFGQDFTALIVVHRRRLGMQNERDRQQTLTRNFRHKDFPGQRIPFIVCE